MFYRHLFDTIFTKFRGILRVFVNFVGFRGFTWISQLRDRAKYQKPCKVENVTSRPVVKWYQGRKCSMTVVKWYQGRKGSMTVVKWYQGRKCSITVAKWYQGRTPFAAVLNFFYFGFLGLSTEILFHKQFGFPKLHTIITLHLTSFRSSIPLFLFLFIYMYVSLITTAYRKLL